ncbi:HisA/HisF-related TIM barrel protein [Methylobacterium organophilum]|uniref:HisA/HisF-related TIM barrel protein n=1 Tax=Methylobacterium organophilum TaxID=410 RepID=UPI001F138915|nr:HisA/HisF-related TIM barrel protein [Methylobacterium organophilum]UMY16911.1 HisA/HisF-related TIM barrel protein [Methylobacterium organophilum]
MPVRVIPVIDLRGGVVVRARAGERDAYAPIHTPLASGSGPAEVAAGLLAAYPSDTLYVADLDAIVSGRPPDRASLAAIAKACPGTALWVDAGFGEEEGVARFLEAGFGRPVLGSESQTGTALLERFREAAVLSLDSRGGERLGPAALHAEPALWPGDVIVMTLARVGAGQGPDLAALAAVRALAPGCRVHAAGGVRGPEDLAALAGIGVAGALVATAIHDGRLRRV